MPLIRPGATHVAAQQGGFEPQRKNNWAIDFALGDGNAQDILSLSLKGSPFPKEGNARKAIKYFNESRHYAGSVDPFEALTVRYHDYVDRAVLAACIAWRRQVWDPATGAIGLASQYKKRGTLYFYPPNAVSGAAGNGSRTWALVGCWPVSLTTDELDMDNDGDPVEISLEVSIDRAVAEFAGGSEINVGITGQSGLSQAGTQAATSVGGDVNVA